MVFIQIIFWTKSFFTLSHNALLSFVFVRRPCAVDETLKSKTMYYVSYRATNLCITSAKEPRISGTYVLRQLQSNESPERTYYVGYRAMHLRNLDYVLRQLQSNESPEPGLCITSATEPRIYGTWTMYYVSYRATNLRNLDYVLRQLQSHGSPEPDYVLRQLQSHGSPEPDYVLRQLQSHGSPEPGLCIMSATVTKLRLQQEEEEKIKEDEGKVGEGENQELKKKERNRSSLFTKKS